MTWAGQSKCGEVAKPVKRQFLMKLWLGIRDLMEVYVPCAAFVAMLVAFFFEVFSRYVLNQPLTWPYEITVIGYLWTSVLGASLATRHKAHVSFTSIYDKSSPRARVIMRLTGSFLLLVPFCIALVPCYNYISFMRIQLTTVFRFRYNIVYAPFMVFMALTIIYVASDIVTDVRRIMKR